MGQDKLWAAQQAELGAMCSEGAAQLIPLIVESLRKGSGSAKKPPAGLILINVYCRVTCAARPLVWPRRRW